MGLIWLTCLCLGSTAHSAYLRNPYVSQKTWNKVSPYFLPEDHPVKADLDLLFSCTRVILNLETLEEAGFIAPHVQKFTRTVVTRHPGFPGYIFKLYLDAQRYFKETEWECWIRRVSGAQATQTAIDARGLQNLFKVPKKWIYPLPPEPSPSDDFIRKNFILVEEDMDLCEKKLNESLWGGHRVSSALLDEFFYILETVGLNDSAKPHNASFSNDGRIAFIDTEWHHHWPVAHKALTPYLSSANRAYWKRLIKKARN